MCVTWSQRTIIIIVDVVVVVVILLMCTTRFGGLLGSSRERTPTGPYLCLRLAQRTCAVPQPRISRVSRARGDISCRVIRACLVCANQGRATPAPARETDSLQQRQQLDHMSPISIAQYLLNNREPCLMTNISWSELQSYATQLSQPAGHESTPATVDNGRSCES